MIDFSAIQHAQSLDLGLLGMYVPYERLTKLQETTTTEWAENTSQRKSSNNSSKANPHNVRNCFEKQTEYCTHKLCPVWARSIAFCCNTSGITILVSQMIRSPTTNSSFWMFLKSCSSGFFHACSLWQKNRREPSRFGILWTGHLCVITYGICVITQYIWMHSSPKKVGQRNISTKCQRVIEI